MKQKIESLIRMIIAIVVGAAIYYGTLHVCNELNYREIVDLAMFPAIEDIVLGYNFVNLVKKMTIESLKVVLPIGVLLQLLGILWYIQTDRGVIERTIISSTVTTFAAAGWIITQYEMTSFTQAYLIVCIPTVIMSSSCFWFISEVVPELKDTMKYVPKVNPLVAKKMCILLQKYLAKAH